MAKHKYSTNLDGAKAVGRDLPISRKHSVEVCSFIRGKNIQTAKSLLQEVIAQKRAVPYRRYNWDIGHKKGMASGRYPMKTSKEILKILESAEVNAQFKGMNTSKLHIAHIAAHKASSPLHGGRHRGLSMKRTHIEVIVQEREEKERGKRKETKKREVKEKRKEVKNNEEEKKVKAASGDIK